MKAASCRWGSKSKIASSRIGGSSRLGIRFGSIICLGARTAGFARNALCSVFAVGNQTGRTFPSIFLDQMAKCVSPRGFDLFSCGAGAVGSAIRTITLVVAVFRSAIAACPISNNFNDGFLCRGFRFDNGGLLRWFCFQLLYYHAKIL